MPQHTLTSVREAYGAPLVDWYLSSGTGTEEHLCENPLAALEYYQAFTDRELERYCEELAAGIPSHLLESEADRHDIDYEGISADGLRFAIASEYYTLIESGDAEYLNLCVYHYQDGYDVYTILCQV